MQIPDIIKVPTVGASGSWLSFKLAMLSPRLAVLDFTLDANRDGKIDMGELSLLLSLGVSLVTIVWLGIKVYYLIKTKGKLGE